MKVVILCGGLGTRLREETEFRPKPMVEVGGRPILWHIMKTYAHYGLQEFILCLGYRGNVIKEYFLNYEAMNNDFTIALGNTQSIEPHGTHSEQEFRVTLVDTGPETMTGGRVKRIERFVDEDVFMVTYGDGLADINPYKLLEFHRSHGRLATVTTVHPVSRFGVLDVTSDGLVRSFVEKPQDRGVDQCRVLRVPTRRVRLPQRRRHLHHGARTDGPAGCRRPVDGLPSRGLLLGHGHLSRIRGPEQDVELRQRALEGVEMISPQSQFWSGRSVLVTGHTGFKGSWLAIWLHRLGARVTGYALAPNTGPSNFAASHVEGLLAGHVEADVREAARLHQAIDEADPDVVFHLAAQSLVRTSYVEPRETFDVNVIGTATVLDAVRARGKPCVVVVITSDKCYENREQVWGYREIDPLGGHDPYSASKAAAEILVAAYRRSFFSPLQLARHGVKLATARAGNVIGGGDWAKDRIVVDAVRSLAAGEPVAVRNPKAVRALAARARSLERLPAAGDPHAPKR